MMEIEFQINIKNKDFDINKTFLLKVPVVRSATAPEVVAPINPAASQAIETSDQCKGCHAPIIWRTNRVTGNRSPIDPAPNPSGECVLDPDGIHFDQIKHSEGKPDQIRFMNHFKTCPMAAQFSKKRS